jgi:transcription antitermination protein NusB
MKPHARRKARSLALQAVYQWQLNVDSVANIKIQFLDKINSNKVDATYFIDLLDGVIRNVEVIDNIIVPFLDRKLKELDPVELAVMRLATYELMQRLDVPYKVVINEALELTKNFGSVEGYKYVNGILDKAARQLRAQESK